MRQSGHGGGVWSRPESDGRDGGTAGQYQTRSRSMKSDRHQSRKNGLHWLFKPLAVAMVLGGLWLVGKFVIYFYRVLLGSVQF